MRYDNGSSVRISLVDIGEICRQHGINQFATMPVPQNMPSEGLDRMLADGIGDMRWMALRRELRLAPSRLVPEAGSLLIAALAYSPRADDASPDMLKRARYAAGSDYHKLLRRKLSNIGKQLCPGGVNRAVVDSAPVNERTLAAMAGLGWIGRNSLLITPGRGSYQFLGVLFTSADLEFSSSSRMPDRCGSCTACEAGCPTGALADRRVITERCISYLTIEHHGVIPRHLAAKFGGWWFGCDICQQVCPWNRFAPEAEDARLCGSDTEAGILAVDATSFDQYFAGRAVRRIGYDRFRRNLMVALFSIGRLDEARAIGAQETDLVRDQAFELGL